MKEILDIDWDNKCKNLSTNEQWEVFQETLGSAVEQCIPKISVNRNRKNKVNLESKKFKSKIRQKQRLWNRYVKDGDLRAYEDYKLTRNQIRNLTRKMVKQREKKIAENSKSNPKAFWNYVNRKTKTKVSVTDLYKDENKLIPIRMVHLKPNTSLLIHTCI